MVLGYACFVEWGRGELSQCIITNKSDYYFPVITVTFVGIQEVCIMIACHS